MQQENNHATKGLIRLTMACNERCSFCNVPMENYPHPTPKWDAIIAQLEQFIESKAQTLTISGGEPTLLRRRLLDLIQLAKQRGIPFIELQSNAVLIDTQYAQQLKEAGLTSSFISLLSHDPQLHDQGTLLEGSFVKCLQGIQALIDVGIEVTLNPVITSATQNGILEYLRFVHEQFPQIKTISLSVVQPHGRANEDMTLLPNYALLKDIIPKAIALSQEFNIALINPYCGLPLCIGWDNHLQNSVEAQNEPHRAINLQNDHNKSKHRKCFFCLYHHRCGGAWHDYWDYWKGQGIQPPKEMTPPWIEIVNSDEQQVYQPIDLAQWLETTRAPQAQSHFFVEWLVLNTFQRRDIENILKSRCSEVLLFLDWAQCDIKETIRNIRTLYKFLSMQKQRLHLLLWRRTISVEKMRIWLGLFESLGCSWMVIEEKPQGLCFEKYDQE